MDFLLRRGSHITINPEIQSSKFSTSTLLISWSHINQIGWKFLWKLDSNRNHSCNIEFLELDTWRGSECDVLVVVVATVKGPFLRLSWRQKVSVSFGRSRLLTSLKTGKFGRNVRCADLKVNLPWCWTRYSCLLGELCSAIRIDR